MKPLDIESLIKSAKDFCTEESAKNRSELFGITDGKAIGTIVEHEFQDFLSQRYDLQVGCSAEGLDLPSVNCDVKTTSISQPQSSCPFKDSKQKIYGLNYHLLVFVYDKHDDVKSKTGCLEFVSCTFIDKSRTADYQTTKGIKDIIERNGNRDDIFAYLVERNIPADEVTLWNIADDLLKNPPQLGYLTISNALQWRLHYGRIVNLDEKVNGITPIIKYGTK
ncbi:MAG: restriction endonuclease [Paludibacteraceae bacterium]|nr:restriction endonuclease [Paludibacteraceae bacterium]